MVELRVIYFSSVLLLFSKCSAFIMYYFKKGRKRKCYWGGAWAGSFTTKPANVCRRLRLRRTSVTLIASRTIPAQPHKALPGRHPLCIYKNRLHARPPCSPSKPHHQPPQENTAHANPAALGGSRGWGGKLGKPAPLQSHQPF